MTEKFTFEKFPYPAWFALLARLKLSNIGLIHHVYSVSEYVLELTFTETVAFCAQVDVSGLVIGALGKLQKDCAFVETVTPRSNVKQRSNAKKGEML